MLLWATLLMGAYCGLAMIYLGLEDWTPNQAVYFAMMSMSTVGYGDISPSVAPATSRAFTLFMILLGVAVVFPAVGGALSTVVFAPITSKCRKLLDLAFPRQESVYLDADDEATFTVPRHFVIYYAQNLLPSILLNVSLQLVSAGIFCAIEGWDFGSALYHCFVTATTVGYGDQPIRTKSGINFASAHMLLAVVLLAELLGSIDKVRKARKDHLQHVHALTSECDRERLGRMMKAAVELRPLVERDGKGLTELEFVITMLMELEIVDKHLVRPFISQFRTFDLNSDGRLGIDDVDIEESLSPAALSDLKHKNALARKKQANKRDNKRKHGVGRQKHAVPAPVKNVELSIVTPPV